MSLQNRLFAFIKELDIELNCDLREDTSLIKSGLFDSLALFNLASWIEKEIGAPVNLTAFDLSKEWDTIADILNFIEKQRGNKETRKKNAEVS
jgi:acyl carrier protein